MYQDKMGTVDDVLAMIRDGDSVQTGAYGCEAPLLFSRLHELAGKVHGISLPAVSTYEPYPHIHDSEIAKYFNISTTFFTPPIRKLADLSFCKYTPANLQDVAIVELNKMHGRKMLLALTVSEMDENGDFYCSVDGELLPEFLANADRIILEVNHQMPKLYSAIKINIQDVTLLYEYDRPLPILPAPPVTEIEQKIAKNVLSLIHDGDTLQLGIGGMPNAVGEGLMEKNDLGIHTEMFTSSMGRLMKAGVVSNKRKTLHPGISVASFIYGDQELYDFIAERNDILIKPVSYTNDPAVIMQNDNMVSINTCIQVDLTGQICSESIGPRQFSGTGGAFDYAYGAFHAKNGRGIIAMASTAKNGTVSKISAMLDPGSIVSISRNVADYIVTEYGVARLKHASVEERVESLISIAHPDFREQLRDQAKEIRLIR